MIGELTAWIKAIILVVLFATFLEFLLPNNAMQRFIRVIMGLFIMLAILNPIINLLHSKWMPNQVVTISGSNASDIDQAVRNVSENRSKITHEMYRKELSRQIRALVMAIDGVADARIAVDTNTEEQAKTLGSINRITVFVQPGLASEGNKINKVVIGNKPAEAKQQELSAATKDKITRTIVELYQIKNDKIDIKRMN